MGTMKLFHAGFRIIRRPEITAGRRNADFGQGFYLSEDSDFCRRWARERIGQTAWLNEYELETEGLAIRRLSRNREWFDFICSNRAGSTDALAGYDAVIGPVANDTIFATWGIITSGLLGADQALNLLSFGPEYTQVALKTEKAAAALRFRGAEEMDSAEIAAWREKVRAEEARFQEEFLMRLGKITGLESISEDE